MRSVEQQTARGGQPVSRTEGTMRAIVMDRYGSPDVLELQQVSKPRVGDDDVLIRVRGGRRPYRRLAPDDRPAVPDADHGVRAPRAQERVRRAPMSPGRSNRSARTSLDSQTGDEVFGTCDGSFAEYATARVDTIAAKPANLTFEQAAAVPTSACTALQALRAGGVESGQQVLIVGASGGVGMFAVQIAKSFGAAVTGVCSTAKLDLVRSIGADHVIDYTQDDFTRSGQRYDLILDMGGNRSLSQLRRALSPTRDARAGRRRRGRSVDRRRDGTLAASGRAVAIREPATPDGFRSGPERRPPVPDRTHRGRRGHPGHRPDVSAERGP